MAKSKTPLELVTDLLAQMTARAIEAEMQRDAACQRADSWYELHQRKEEQLKKANEQIEELAGDLKRALDYIEKLEKQGANT